MQIIQLGETLESHCSLLFSEPLVESLLDWKESISIVRVTRTALYVAMIAALYMPVSAPTSFRNDPFLTTPINLHYSLPNGVSEGRAWLGGMHPWQQFLDIDQEKPFLAMYKVSSFIENFLSKGEYSQIDLALSSLDVEESSVGLLISILSTTSFAKSQLPSRASFFQRVNNRVLNRGEIKLGLLDGLS